YTPSSHQTNCIFISPTSFFSLLSHPFSFSFFFFFNDTATTEIYTLSLHDALPISLAHASDGNARLNPSIWAFPSPSVSMGRFAGDRKSTRLNSSHRTISYAVFCLKKKKKKNKNKNA